MLFAHTNYPAHPLPPIAAVLLEAFHANERCRESDQDGGAQMLDIEYQRACALYSGARNRALTAGRKDSHADQAATLLVMINDLDFLLEGHWSIGGKLPLDDDEKGIVRAVREASVKLLRWHFENGAGELRPIAQDLGLLRGDKS